MHGFREALTRLGGAVAWRSGYDIGASKRVLVGVK